MKKPKKPAPAKASDQEEQKKAADLAIFMGNAIGPIPPRIQVMGTTVLLSSLVITTFNRAGRLKVFDGLVAEMRSHIVVQNKKDREAGK